MTPAFDAALDHFEAGRLDDAAAAGRTIPSRLAASCLTALGLM